MLFVSAGTLDHASGAEVSAPSHVYSFGTSPLAVNAVELTSSRTDAVIGSRAEPPSRQFSWLDVLQPCIRGHVACSVKVHETPRRPLRSRARDLASRRADP